MITFVVKVKKVLDEIAREIEIYLTIQRCARILRKERMKGY